MSLLDRLRRFPKESEVKAIAQQVASRARHDVWQRVCGRVAAMGINEARGYIRARAKAVVAREIEIALAQTRRVRNVLRDRVTELANELVVRAVVSQSRVMQPVVEPVRRAV